MSYAFTTALRQDPQQSYVELLNSIRDILETKYSQRPQLSSSHPIGEVPPCSPCLPFWPASSLICERNANKLLSRHGDPFRHVVE
jgi:hypothetical protein